MPVSTVYVLQSESFWNKAFPVFLGALFGFLFGLALNSLNDRRIKNDQKKNLAKLTDKEISYDLSVITKIENELDDRIKGITSGRAKIYSVYDHGVFLSQYLVNTFNQGYIFDILSDAQVREFYELITYFNVNTSNLLNTYIEEYENKKINKSQIVDNLQFHLSKTRSYKDLLTKIQTDFQKQIQ